jgi:hypothetical protein
MREKYSRGCDLAKKIHARHSIVATNVPQDPPAAFDSKMIPPRGSWHGYLWDTIPHSKDGGRRALDATTMPQEETMPADIVVANSGQK